jgi:hypothetical protein
MRSDGGAFQGAGNTMAIHSCCHLCSAEPKIFVKAEILKTVQEEVFYKYRLAIVISALFNLLIRRRQVRLYVGLENANSY